MANSADNNYFESVLNMDQQSFLDELAQEQQQYYQQQYYDYSPPEHQNYDPATTPYNPSSCGIIMNSNPPEEVEVIEMQPPVNPPVFHQSIISTCGGPKTPTVHHFAQENAIPPAPKPMPSSQFINLRDALSKDPELKIFDSLNPKLVAELKYLGIKASFISLLLPLPIHQVHAGVYKLLFYFNIKDIFQAALGFFITDDYPAEAPVVDFSSLAGTSNARVRHKIRKEIAEVKFSFLIRDIVMGCAKVFIEAYRSKVKSLIERKENEIRRQKLATNNNFSFFQRFKK